MLENLTQLAIRAHNGTSFSPEKQGRSLIESYSQELQSDLEEIKKVATLYDQDSAGACERYQQRYEYHLQNWLSSKSNCISSMIAGPSNFPVRRMEKLNRWEHNKYEFFREWRARCLVAIKKGFQPKITPLTELEKVRKDIESRESKQVFMKQCNLILRKAKGKDCTGELVHAGVSKGIAIELQQPDCMGTIGFARYALQNNNANIVRLKKRLVELETKANRHVSGDVESIKYEGVKVVENYEADRIQLQFDAKPIPAVISLLKKNGWRWSPFFSSWQRKLTPNAKRDANHLLTLIKNLNNEHN